MEVPGTAKSIYFDTENFSKAERLQNVLKIDSLSKLVRVLIEEKYCQMGLEKKQSAEKK